MRYFLQFFVPSFFLLLAMFAKAQHATNKVPPSLRSIDSTGQFFLRSRLSRQGLPVTVPNASARAAKASFASRLYSISPTQLNGNQTPQCIDTSMRLMYGQQYHWMGNDFISRTHDGNVLIPGWDQLNTSPYTTFPRLLKCTLQGDTLWSRSILAGYDSTFTDLYHAFELANGDILLVGDLSVPMRVNGREDFLMVKLSATGSLLWEKTFSSSLWNQDTTSGSIFIYDCKQDASDNVYLCGSVQHFGPSRSSLVFKMDTNGNVLWSKGFPIYDIPYFTGLDVVGDTLKVLGCSTNDATIKQFGIAFNAATGDTLFTRAWQAGGTKAFWHSFFCRGVTKLSNGNYVLNGEGASTYYNTDSTELSTHFGTVELSPSFDFVKGTLFRSTAQASSNSVISVFSDGSAVFERMQFKSLYSSNLIIGSVRDGQIVKERVIPYYGLSTNWTSNFLQMPDGGHLTTNWSTDSLSQISGIELVRLHDSDTSGSCLGHDTVATIVEPVQLDPTNLYMDSISTNVLFERVHPFRGITVNSFFTTSTCQQISYCDSLKLFPSLTTLCPGTPVSMSIRKNKACGAFPTFNYDTTSVQSFVRVSDTIVSLTFKRPWQGYITAGISGCQPLIDSVKFTVLQAPPQLSLGPDTVICPGNTVLLNAGSGYVSYRWQDGSSDSLFTITKPGKYYVTTLNACGSAFSDTVIAASHPPIPFDVSSDIAICEGKSASVTAQPGFISYQWFPSTGISSDTAQTVTFSPSVSTLYKVTAEQTPGCFASDSFLVRVNKVSAIRLGADTSLCSGQSLYLDAGTSFSSYQWSTGDTTQTIRAIQKGSYWVTATSSNGCSSSDTLSIVGMYPLPSFTLGNDTTLCENKPLAYQFNLPDASYLWNDGSSLSHQIISQPGSYWLSVTQHGCTKYDTITVAFQPSPVVNLGHDTTLCEGTTKLLDAANLNAVYRWQDNSSSFQYLVQQAGLYAVTATIGRCSSSDSVQVTYMAKPHFNLGKDTFMCEGSALLLSPLLNTSVTYVWQDSSTLSSYWVQHAGAYSLSASNDCGSLTDSVHVSAEVCKLNMPSAFTPNKDGLNDIFKVNYPFPVKQFNLVIYNRWGQKMFASNDITRGWDGTINTIDQDPGTYIWMISLVGSDNAKQTARGTVTLIR